MSQSDRIRRHRAAQFMSLEPDAAFEQYDAMTEAERFDLLAVLDPEQRAVFEAAIRERLTDEAPRFRPRSSG